MQIIRKHPHMTGYGWHAAFISRLITVHVWRGTFAGWTVCVNVFGIGGRCWNRGQPW